MVVEVFVVGIVLYQGAQKTCYLPIIDCLSQVFQALKQEGLG